RPAGRGRAGHPRGVRRRGRRARRPGGRAPGAGRRPGAVAAARVGPAGRDGLAVCLVDGAAGGLTRSPLTTADPTRALARITLADTPGRILAGNAASALRAAAD